MLILLALATVSACSVTDGDTIRCAPPPGSRRPERVRLLGIDAPERLPCPRFRRCAPGDPIASTRSLRTAMARGPLTITRIGTDRYGRTLALVRAGQTDLSCWQLRHRQATYRPDWDNGQRLASICPSASSR